MQESSPQTLSSSPAGIPYCLCCNLQVTKETMDMRSALQQLRMQAGDASIYALKTLSRIHLFP